MGWEIFLVVYLAGAVVEGAAWEDLRHSGQLLFRRQAALVVAEPEASARLLLLRLGLPEIPYPYSGDNLWP